MSVGRTAAPGIIHDAGAVFKKRVENAVLIGVPFIGSLIAIQHIYQNGISLIDAASFLLFYVSVGIGVGLGLHRYFSHRSFQTGPVLAVLLAALGSMAFQGSVFRWVIDHRRHHAHTDKTGDTHSPVCDPWGKQHAGIRGLLYAHIGWMFDGTVTDPDVYGRGLLRDPIVYWFTRSHWMWPAMSLLLPYCFGYALGGPDAAWSSMLIGGFLRTTILHNVVWAVNSIGHFWGSTDYQLNNSSKNNYVLALLTFGDGWHNNHHRYPRSYRHGLHNGQADTNAAILEQLERHGVVWSIVRAREEGSHAQH